MGVAVATALGACQTFAPVDPRAVEAGDPVRVTLTREEALKQADVIGELTERVEGRVAEPTDAAALALTIPARGSTPATGSRFNTYLALPWDGLVSVEEKRFSWARTGALAAVTGVAVAVILSVTEGSSQGGPGEGPPDNSDIRFLGFRLQW
ncbi:MAG: hypothetical protein R3E10_04185 [Gemmatimonadota bacterium]